MQMVMPSTSEHLAAYSRMDISLDTFPYAGTTTTVEALLMGVPVITLQARRDNATHSQNVGVSLLSQVGLHELIAKDEDEYFDIAVQLARSPERIRSYRDTLRDRLLSSPLCSGQTLMSNVEAEYRRMWTRFCKMEGKQEERGGEVAEGGGREKMEEGKEEREEGEGEQEGEECMRTIETKTLEELSPEEDTKDSECSTTQTE